MVWLQLKADSARYAVRDPNGHGSKDNPFAQSASDSNRRRRRSYARSPLRAPSGTRTVESYLRWADAFLASYAPRAFDCLITDIRMPGISGLELQQKLNSLGSTIPVIVVTSSNDPLTRSRSLKEGAIAYLSKPVKDEVLIRHLMAALGRDFGWRDRQRSSVVLPRNMPLARA